jgi:hypothetical protein
MAREPVPLPDAPVNGSVLVSELELEVTHPAALQRTLSPNFSSAPPHQRGEAGTTQLVRLHVAERREAWTTDVVKRRADLEDAAVIGSTVALIAGTRLVALDSETGTVRWSRGKAD